VRGVGSSLITPPSSLSLSLSIRQASAAKFRPCFPASCDGVLVVCRFSFGDARGGGSSCTAAEGDGRDPSSSATPGSRTEVRVVLRPWVASGVGSRPREDEAPFALVGGSDVGGGKAQPFRIEPDRGQVPEYVG